MVQVAKALVGKYPVRTLEVQLRAMVRCLNCPGGPWDIGVMLTTDQHIRQLNHRYRQKNKPTDILSFPFHKITTPGRFPRTRSSDERYLGDIFISPSYVQQQCDNPELEEITTLEERLPVLLAHGICHLMGYDHERDADYERMQKAEAYILRRYKQFLPDSSAEKKDAVNTNSG